MAVYPLGMSPEEIERLRRQHDTWREPTEQLWRRAGFGPGQTIVDLGCGPGFASRDLARVVTPGGRVIAVDSSADGTEVLRTSATPAEHAALDIITADAHAIDLSNRTLDGVFARWLFCYLAEPIEVLRRVTSHLRPGGALAVLDYWNYRAIRTEPHSDLFARVFAAVYDSFRDAGGSLDVAGAIAQALPSLGFEAIDVTPVSAIGHPGSPVWQWIAEFQALYLPSLVARGYLTAPEAEAYGTWWRGLERTPGVFVFAPPMLAIMARKR